jgi:hypothetical protein
MTDMKQIASFFSNTRGQKNIFDTPQHKMMMMAETYTKAKEFFIRDFLTIGKIVDPL